MSNVLGFASNHRASSPVVCWSEGPSERERERVKERERGRDPEKECELWMDMPCSPNSYERTAHLSH